MGRSGVSARRHGRPQRPLRASLLLILGVLMALLPTAPASLAVPSDGIDIPQPTRVERFNPDQQVCLPRNIKAAYANHLQPWADQPPAVLEQLRRVQQEMTRATVKRCVDKGLLPPAEASQLERELGLQPGSASGSPAAPTAVPSPRAVPSPTPAPTPTAAPAASGTSSTARP